MDGTLRDTKALRGFGDRNLGIPRFALATLELSPIAYSRFHTRAEMAPHHIRIPDKGGGLFFGAYKNFKLRTGTDGETGAVPI